MKLRIVAVEGGAVGADELAVAAHVAEHVRMIERGRRADAHEFLGADLNHRDAGIIVEMRNDMVGHLCSRGRKSSAGTIAGGGSLNNRKARGSRAFRRGRSPSAPRAGGHET